MSKYGKFWAALAGTLGVGLTQFGVVDTGQSQAIVTSAISLLAAFGVYQIPNR
jgi:hypothetical protein